MALFQMPKKYAKISDVGISLKPDANTKELSLYLKEEAFCLPSKSKVVCVENSKRESEQDEEDEQEEEEPIEKQKIVEKKGVETL